MEKSMAPLASPARPQKPIIANYAALTAMQIQRDATDEKTTANLGTIKREAIRLGDLVEQLKTDSLEKERNLNLTHIEAGELLKQAADFCEYICKKNQNRITVSPGTEKIFLHVNTESIFQTLINLIINANRHTRAGTIRLKAEGCNEDSRAGFAKLTVSDDGDGIDPKLQPNIFNRGVSGDKSSGLGLAISKEFILEHGGEIWIESEKGKGTAICFTLPCSKGDDTP